MPGLSPACQPHPQIELLRAERNRGVERKEPGKGGDHGEGVGSGGDASCSALPPGAGQDYRQGHAAQRNRGQKMVDERATWRECPGQPLAEEPDGENQQRRGAPALPVDDDPGNGYDHQPVEKRVAVGKDECALAPALIDEVPHPASGQWPLPPWRRIAVDDAQIAVVGEHVPVQGDEICPVVPCFPEVQVRRQVDGDRECHQRDRRPAEMGP